jgi:hypothetical protein
VIDDGDPLGQGVGLFQVVGGEEDRDSFVAKAADLLPQVGPALGIQPGGRLVQEQY